MTLDIAKYLENLVRKEAKISHFAVKVAAGHTDKLSMSVRSSIQSEYGESYLQDSDFIMFFTKTDGWKEGDSKKLFDLVNRGLGKDANGMTESDFKKLTKKETTDTGDDDEEGNEEGSEKEETAETSTDTSTLFLKITIK